MRMASGMTNTHAIHIKCYFDQANAMQNDVLEFGMMKDLQVLVPSPQLSEQHYAEHKGKPFFPGLVQVPHQHIIYYHIRQCYYTLSLYVRGGALGKTAFDTLLKQHSWNDRVLSLPSLGQTHPAGGTISLVDVQVKFLSSGPVIATVWEGKDVIKTSRGLIGATNPLASPPGTIRQSYIQIDKISDKQNLPSCHLALGSS